MKWVALALIVAGIVLLIKAVRRDHDASFDDGSFLGEMLDVIGGIVCLAAGVIWLAVLLFASV